MCSCQADGKSGVPGPNGKCLVCGELVDEKLPTIDKWGEAIPRVGDALVIQKGSTYDVMKLETVGWTERRLDLPDIDVARDVARMALEPDGSALWFRLEGQPDSAIRPFKGPF
jgi:hypothetical protein